MAHYTMVKTSTFNGTRLPAIALWNSATDALEIVREFVTRSSRDGSPDPRNRVAHQRTCRPVFRRLTMPRA